MANGSALDTSQDTSMFDAGYETQNYSENTPVKEPTETKSAIEGAYSGIAEGATDQTLNVDEYDPTKVKDKLGDTTQYKEGTSYIDKAKSTVAGQLETLLNKENRDTNPLFQQAESRGEVGASRRGQLGSSMGIGAVEGQVYNQAMDIARQDAQTFAQADLAQQQAEYGTAKAEKEAVLSSEVQKYTADIERANKNIDQQFTALMTSADKQTQASLSALQKKYKEDYAILDAKIRENIVDKELDARKKQMAYEQSANILQNYQVTVENMMTNPNFLELGREAIVNSINQIQNLATNQVNFIGNAVGVDFTDLIDFYFDPVLTTEDIEG